MSVFFTSDLHIGHKMVARLRATNAMIARLNIFDTEQDEQFCVDWHDATLASYWDAAVTKDDQVWVLGDISAGGKSSQRKALEWLAERPGEKHLIAGNHDGVHPMHRDSHKMMAEYHKVFASVQALARRKIAAQPVLLSHFPYSGDHTEKERFNQYRLRDCGEILLHGHVHTADKVTYAEASRFGVPTSDRGSTQIHVGLDAWGLRPAHLDELVALIEGRDE